jgi:hypothetical protein
LRRDEIEAARLALRALAVDAVATLGGVMGGKSTAAINAANSILDRVGLPKQSDVKHSGIGEGGAIPIEHIGLSDNESETALDALYRRILAEAGTADTEVGESVEQVRSTGDTG